MDRRKIIIIASFCIAVAGVVAGSLAVAELSKRSELDHTMSQLSVLSGAPAKPTFSERIATAQDFVYSHSNSHQGEEFERTWRDASVIASLYLARAEGRRDKLVEAECSTRTGVLVGMLESMGIRTRNIDLYNSKDLSGHSFLDVWNDEEKRWESWDPLLNAYWRSTATREKVSVAEAAGDLTKIEPCGIHGCGWQLPEGKWLKSILDLIVVREDNHRMTVYTPRADINAVHERRGVEGTFCDVLAKNCEDGFAPIAGISPTS